METYRSTDKQEIGMETETDRQTGKAQSRGVGEEKKGSGSRGVSDYNKSRKR